MRGGPGVTLAMLLAIVAAGACSSASGPSTSTGDDGGSTTTCTGGGPSVACAGRCGQLATSCGIADCGGCPAGQACGGGGVNLCGTGACTSTCAGKACGASDGCSGVCTEGSCPAGQACLSGVCGGATGGDGGGTPDASSVDAPAAEAGPTLLTCQETCGSSADCATAGVALYDATHYACTTGVCKWLGCLSDADCTAAYHKPNFACGAVTGVPVPDCYETCTTSADCASAGVALYDATHYACNGGQCQWLGCQSNTDCTAAFQKPNYACGNVPGVSVPDCFPTCSAPADCATAGLALYDASHYACDSGRCDWLGCTSPSDCTSAYMKSNYTCQ